LESLRARTQFELMFGPTLVTISMQGTTMSYVSSRMGSLDTCSSRITGDESRNRFLFGVSFTLERFDVLCMIFGFMYGKTLMFHHVTCYVNLTYESYAFWFSVSVLFGF
ncbi:unnamed protein product, partial [Brassica oleracea var. botrytis]